MLEAEGIVKEMGLAQAPPYTDINRASFIYGDHFTIHTQEDKAEPFVYLSFSSHLTILWAPDLQKAVKARLKAEVLVR